MSGEAQVGYYGNFFLRKNGEVLELAAQGGVGVTVCGSGQEKHR